VTGEQVTPGSVMHPLHAPARVILYVVVGAVTVDLLQPASMDKATAITSADRIFDPLRVRQQPGVVFQPTLFGLPRSIGIHSNK
jgi:hypothetical protein